jgi:hypothetical protein
LRGDRPRAVVVCRTAHAFLVPSYDAALQVDGAGIAVDAAAVAICIAIVVAGVVGNRTVADVERPTVGVQPAPAWPSCR